VLLAVLTLAAAPLVPAKTDLARPVPLPKNPFLEPTSAQVKLGYKLFTKPSGGNKLSCASCHLDAGQKELALPLAGIANVLEARTLEDRITVCYERSLDGEAHEQKVDAVAAYLRFISAAVSGMPWRGRGALTEVEVSKLDAKRGAVAYAQHCAACHGADGQGVQLERVKPAPLWGEGSWNDGAPFARVNVLAGYIRWAMPYWAPGSLDDGTSLELAAFIEAQERPEWYGARGEGDDEPDERPEKKKKRKKRD